MHLNAAALAALLLLPTPGTTLALKAKPCRPCSPKPPAFILAGDSTTAVQAANGGGWGNGFLSFLRAPPAWGINKGHNGATTVSFVKGGDWANVTRLVDEKKAKGYQVWVTVQFGHNDQPGATSPRTPRTTRRIPLHNERLATIAAFSRVTNTTGTTSLVDLNAASLTYVNRIGSDAAHAYDLKEGDGTHLNDWGSVVFGRMVADLLLETEAGRCLGPWIRPNETLSQAIRDGVPV
ncbi:hypothetical protein PG994_013934 [Apiospora phragmitis]|uniref:SGNH hydrolase-type esterase domain-containing protein n=1 Tax=Apiospora phragmitis TaxID=2905665 RepID=A0ABR1T3B2_9PEZI